MSYKNISELKDKHKGEDIWVIAAGSSMDYVDKSFFSNKIVIGQNQTFKKYPCDYIVMKDCNELPRFPRSIKKLDELGIPLIFSEYYKGNHWQGKNVVKHKDSYMFTHQNRQLSNSFEGHIANLDDEMIMASKSTITSIIHIAAHMGASNIMVCGHDCGTLDGNLYYDGYMEKDWVSAGNWGSIKVWMKKIDNDTELLRDYLNKRYGCNVHSLNPFLNFELEGHKYERL